VTVSLAAFTMSTWFWKLLLTKTRFLMPLVLGVLEELLLPLPHDTSKARAAAQQNRLIARFKTLGLHLIPQNGKLESAIITKQHARSAPGAAFPLVRRS
jgi:hypothetical protein